MLGGGDRAKRRAVRVARSGVHRGQRPDEPPPHVVVLDGEHLVDVGRAAAGHRARHDELGDEREGRELMGVEELRRCRGAGGWRLAGAARRGLRAGGARPAPRRASRRRGRGLPRGPGVPSGGSCHWRTCLLRNRRANRAGARVEGGGRDRSWACLAGARAAPRPKYPAPAPRERAYWRGLNRLGSSRSWSSQRHVAQSCAPLPPTA